MEKFKKEEIVKKVGKTVYLKEGVRKVYYNQDFLDKKESAEVIQEINVKNSTN